MKFSSEFEPRDFAITYDTRFNTVYELVPFGLEIYIPFLIQSVFFHSLFLCFCKPRNALQYGNGDGTIVESFAH